MLGVSFRNGGERDGDDFPVPVGYRVQHADHWVYAGTGLADGDVFGEKTTSSATSATAQTSTARTSRPAGRSTPPAPTRRPTTSPSSRIGDCRASGWGFGNGAATMGCSPAPAAEPCSPRRRPTGPGCSRAGDPAVERITRTVLDRLGAPPA